MAAGGGKKRSERWLGILLGAAFIAAAAALFLMSDAGRGLFAQSADASAEPSYALETGEKTAGADLPQEESFIEAVRAGLGGELDRLSHDAQSALYRIPREGFEDAQLTLSLEDGRVCAFMLSWRCTAKAADDPESSVSADYAAMLSAARDEDEKWLRAAFHALVAALEGEDGMSFARIDMLADDILLTADDGKKRSGSADGCTFSADRAEGETRIYFIRENAKADDN